jgi:hypothetical protein
MRKVRCLAVLALAVTGIAILAMGGEVVPTPRTYQTADGVVYLYDNNTGASQSGLIVILLNAGTIDIQDVTAFGGEEVASVVQLGSRVVRIDVDLVPGGTLQIALPTGVAISWALFIP